MFLIYLRMVKGLREALPPKEKIRDRSLKKISRGGLPLQNPLVRNNASKCVFRANAKILFFGGYVV